MMLRVRRYTLPLLGAGSLALVIVASFLILDLTGAGLNLASDLPVVDIGQAAANSPGQEEGPSAASPGAGIGVDAAQGRSSSATGRQEGSGGRGSAQAAGGSVEAAGSGQQNGPGQQSASVEQRGGNESSASIPVGTSVSGNAAPSPQTTPGGQTGDPQDHSQEHASGSSSTGSTLRQTVHGGIRVETGSGGGQGSGVGLSPATGGGGR